MLQALLVVVRAYDPVLRRGVQDEISKSTDAGRTVDGVVGFFVEFLGYPGHDKQNSAKTSYMTEICS